MTKTFLIVGAIALTVALVYWQRETVYKYLYLIKWLFTD